jgi:formaldehyde-activating enzyme involved in methanogenesis
MSKVLEAIKEKQYYDKEQDLWVVSVNHEDEISSTDKSQSSMKVYRTELTQTIQTALERLPKVEELLDLYQLQNEFKERYNTEVRILHKQKTLNCIREIAEEIYLKEKELEELK